MPLLAADGLPFPPLLFALAFLGLGLAIGRRVLLWVGVSEGGTAAERGFVAVAVGVAALQLVPIGLSAFGILGTRSVRIAVSLLAVVAAKDLWAVAVGVRRKIRWSYPSGWQLCWALALLPALLPALLLALAPTIDPDGLVYHLMAPKRWLESGSLGYLPTYAFTNAPMAVEMLFAIALSCVGDAGAKCLHFAFGVLGAAGLVIAGRRLHGVRVGTIAATLFLVGPVAVVPLLGRAYLEGAIAFAMIAAVVAWLVWFQTRQRSWLRCAALLAGVAVSFKITSALFAAALGALTLLAMLDDAPFAARVQGALAAGTSVLRLLPLVIIPVVPWLVRAELVTGNPFFPLFAAWIPTRDLSPTSVAVFARRQRYWGWGAGLLGGWNLEGRGSLLLAASAVAVIVAAYAFTRSRSSMARGSVLVLFGTVLAQLFAVGLNSRFWVALTAVSVLPLVAMFGRVLSSPWVPVPLVAFTLVASGVQLRSVLHDVGDDSRGLIRTAVGLGDRRAFLLRQIPLFPIYEYANRELPTDATILLSYYCGGFYLDRTTFCDESIQDSFHWTTWDEFFSDVRRLGVSHVIAPRVLATGGWPPPYQGATLPTIHYERENQLLGRLLGEHGELLVAAADQGLYALDAGVTRRTP